MPTIDNHSKVNPLSSLGRSTSTMMFDLPQAPTPEPSARGSIGAGINGLSKLARRARQPLGQPVPLGNMNR
jgi:hypothetical protein